jgi:hypothetical protein
MDELSKQLSSQLNETICIEEVGYNTYLLKDKNNKIKIEFHKLQNNSINNSLLLLYKESKKFKKEIDTDYDINFIYMDNIIKNIKIEDNKNKIIIEGERILFESFTTIYAKTVKYKNIINKDFIFHYNVERNRHNLMKITIEDNIYFENINPGNDLIINHIICDKINKYLEKKNDIIAKYGKNCINFYEKLYNNNNEYTIGNSTIEIYNIPNESIDLLEFIPYTKDKIICEGKIKDLFTTNLINITIKNCVNLKNINNYVSRSIYNDSFNQSINSSTDLSKFNLNINIIDCTNLEFIEYYDKFNITIDNKPLLRIKQDDLIKIKEEIQEIKELLKTIKNA